MNGNRPNQIGAGDSDAHSFNRLAPSMRQSLQLGPFAFPVELLILFAAVSLGAFIAKQLSRRLNLDLGRIFWQLSLVLIVVSRLAFVYQYRVGYLQSPLDILNLRDGGWDFQAGLMGTWLYALLIVKRAPVLRKPLIAALAATSVAWGVGSIALAIGSRSDARLSAISLPTFDGRAASLTDFQGKPSVVNLWATWCPPCQRELPLLQQAQAEHPEVHFVFLNQGESAEQVKSFLAVRGYTLQNLLLDAKGQAGAEFGSGALPMTLLFDAQGKLVGSHLGELSRGTLAQSLAKLGLPDSTSK